MKQDVEEGIRPELREAVAGISVFRDEKADLWIAAFWDPTAKAWVAKADYNKELALGMVVSRALEVKR